MECLKSKIVRNQLLSKSVILVWDMVSDRVSSQVPVSIGNQVQARVQLMIIPIQALIRDLSK